MGVSTYSSDWPRGTFTRNLYLTQHGGDLTLHKSISLPNKHPSKVELWVKEHFFFKFLYRTSDYNLTFVREK